MKRWRDAPYKGTTPLYTVRAALRGYFQVEPMNTAAAKLAECATSPLLPFWIPPTEADEIVFALASRGAVFQTPVDRYVRVGDTILLQSDPILIPVKA